MLIRTRCITYSWQQSTRPQFGEADRVHTAVDGQEKTYVNHKKPQCCVSVLYFSQPFSCRASMFQCMQVKQCFTLYYFEMCRLQPAFMFVCTKHTSLFQCFIEYKMKTVRMLTTYNHQANRGLANLSNTFLAPWQHILILVRHRVHTLSSCQQPELSC